MGAFRHRFGCLLGSRKGPWERFGDALDAFWCPVGVPRAPLRGLGCLSDDLRTFWEVFFRFWGGFGRLRGLLRVLLGCLLACLLVLNGDVTLLL